MPHPHLFLFLLFVLVSGLHLHSGSSGLGLLELWQSSENTSQRILELRVARYFCCLLIGGSLSVCGMYFQSSLRNPLAEPFTLGFSGAAALGISVAIFLGLEQPVAIAGFGFVACFAIVGLMFSFLTGAFRRSSADFILIGLGLGFFCHSLVVILQTQLRP